MKLPTPRSAASLPKFHMVSALVCAASLVSSSALFSQEPAAPAQPQVTTNATPPAAATAAPKIPNDQLDSLVAPIALYPDPLLAQTLAAATYPLEVIQLEQWMAKNPNLKDKALADAVAKQPWDPSVQSMAAFPAVVKQLAENVAWSSDLGNAFLAQQADVMDAVQRMRAKAAGKGELKTSTQQKVETKTVESKQVIIIEPADPEVIYVPQYSPTVVYGAPVYPYPYYAPYGGALAFGAGVAMGAAWGGAWGNCNWDNHGDVNINNTNNFNKNTNVNGGNRNQVNNRPANSGGGNWQHNPQHRGGAPYGDKGTANKYGGNARQQPAGGNRTGTGAGSAGATNRPGGGTGAGNVGAGNRPSGGAGASAGNRPSGGAGAGAANRPSGGAAAGGGAGARPGGGASTMPASRPSGGGGNHVGNRSVSSGSSGSAFGGGGGGSSARASSSRGGSSMGGGGFSGGGGGGRGGGGGGGRGGGGGGGGRRR